MLLDSVGWDFIKALENTDGEANIWRLLLRCASPIGFQWAFAGRVPTAITLPRELRSHVLFQEFPDEWAKRYNENHYALRDPVVYHLQRTLSPFTWDECYEAEPRRDNVKLIGGEAANFGLRTGYVIPIRLLGGSPVLSSLLRVRGQ